MSGGPSGDKLGTLVYLLTLAMQHGMVWVGLEDTAQTRATAPRGARGRALSGLAT